ncbi:MAG: GHMP kinase [Candidatus Hydrogenedentes bacterium]|nr:GHMP kinase [Candidatus Hydrogenedentota bacterium]
MACEATAYARAGLIGNPSDGYYGKTISFVIRNFAAKVSLYESPVIEIVPSLQDRSKYASVQDLYEDVKSNGYYGGIRLMKATICKFIEYCEENRIAIPDKKFSIRYRSTIPRRLGLAGSSALITATLRCLMEYYDVEIPKPLQPNLILRVEMEELGISAGLQDRVIQVYEGCVYMDFDQETMARQGYGIYKELDPASLPPLFIAYRQDLGEGSETFHNNIRERWMEGDPEVVQAMLDFASYAEEARGLLEAGRGREIGPLLDKNFNRRRSIFNLDPRNVDMVERARKVGAHAKFSGSGGAIVGCYEDETMYEALLEIMREGNISVFKPVITV